MNPLEHPAVERFAELGPLLAKTGFELERDPEAIDALMDEDLAKVLALIDVPVAFNGFKPKDFGIDYPEDGYPILLAVIERLARFDASSLMAIPGPSLAGAAINAVGTDAQRAAFFTPYLTEPQATFLAITEPSGGSDASNCSTQLVADGDGWRMSGHKILIGGAKRAKVGIVFARFETSQRRALVMLRPPTLGGEFSVRRLPTVGLAGAGLTEIRIDGLAVTREMLIGHESRSLRDGFMAINSVFARHRPLVAAMALGTARGLLDQLGELGADPDAVSPLVLRHEALLARMVRIGISFQGGRSSPHETSQFKLDAVSLVETAIRCAFEVLGPAELLTDPSLMKRIRDGRSFEYMEGSSNIHLLQAFRSYEVRH